MGFSVKFNWVLQVEPPDNLVLNGTHSFKKPDNRIFPIDTPIDLIDDDRNAIAKIKIKSFTNEDGVTSGTFSIVKIYTGQEKVVLTNYWVENK